MVATAVTLGVIFAVSYFQGTSVSANAKNKVKIYEKDGFRVVESNGIPDHATGVFPNDGNPNRISEQKYKYKIPLNPTISPEGFRMPGPPPERDGNNNIGERRGGPPPRDGNEGNGQRGERRGPPPNGGPSVFGVALNGIPFDPGTGEAWNNDMRSGWNNEALTGKINLGTDRNNAHVQPTGAYHYHGIPTGLVEKLAGENIGEKMVLVGYAADGFPIYSQYGYAEADDAKSGIKKLTPSWRLKQGTRPDGPKGTYDGTYLQDFEYVADLGDLDEFNGRTGITPEYPNGTYYYVITDSFPYMSRAFKGIPDKSFQKSGEGGGRRNGQGPPRDGQRPPRGDGQRPPGRPF